MIKMRLMGLPDEVKDLADALEMAGVVLKRSRPYPNRDGSAYVHVCLDVAAPRRPAGEGGKALNPEAGARRG